MRSIGQTPVRSPKLSIQGVGCRNIKFNAQFTQLPVSLAAVYVGAYPQTILLICAETELAQYRQEKSLLTVPSY